MMLELARPVDMLAEKTVLLRANLDDGVTPELGLAVATLADRGARVAIISGFGSPRGEFNPMFSLLRFRDAIAVSSGTPVSFVPDCVGPRAEAGLDRVPFGEAALLENLRFYADEHRDSRTFAIRLSVLGDYFAISGVLPGRPIGWLSELVSILPAPDAAPTATSRNES